MKIPDPPAGEHNLNLLDILRQAGFKGDGLLTAYAVVMAESGSNPSAHNDNRKTGDDSYGLFQINMIDTLGTARMKQFGLKSKADLLDPLVNAKAAFAISKGGKDFGAWTTYNSGAYTKFLPTGALPSAPSTVTTPRVQEPLPVPRQVAPDVGAPAPQTSAATLSTDTLGSDVPGPVQGNGLPAIPQQAQAAQTTENTQQAARQAASAKGDMVAAAAKKYLGVKYSWGGEGPAGVDCSGLVQLAYKAAGIQLPRVSYQQATSGKSVPINQLRIGDLVAWDNNPSLPGADHIAIYLGDGRIIEAAKPGTVVSERALGKDEGAFGVQIGGI
jgi:cell wall-associated NlpC family hydrolase